MSDSIRVGGRRRTFPVIAFLAALGVARVADATEVGVSVVALDGDVEGDALSVEGHAVDWVDRSARFDHVDLEGPALGDTAARIAQRLEQAREAYEEGVSAYDRMSYSDAQEALDRAADRFLSADLTRHLEEYLDTLFIRALVEFYAGDPEAARETLIEVLVIDRDYDLDPSRITPEIDRLLEEAQREVDGLPRAPLEVHTSPVPARVYINGEFVGISPVQQEGLRAGEHVVSAWAPGHQPGQERVTAQPGEIERFDLRPTSEGRELLALHERLGAGLRVGEPHDAAIDLARWSEAEEMVVLGVTRDDDRTLDVEGYRIGADGHLYAHRRGELSRRADRQASEVRTFLEELYARDLPRAEDGSALRRPERGIDIDFGPRVWGLAAAGAGALVGTGGLAVGLSASATAAEARALPQIEVYEYQETMRSARRRAMVADALYVTAAASIGFGVLLFMNPDLFFEEPDGPEGFTLDVLPTREGGLVQVGGRF